MADLCEVGYNYKYIQTVLIYLKLWMFDTIDYYHTYMILSLPSFMFDQPFIHIQQINDSDSDSDGDSESSNQISNISFDIFVSRFILIMYDGSYVSMHGHQMCPFIDDNGHLCIWNIQRYFPDLKTISLNYMKSNVSNDFNNQKLISRIIDVKNRFDVLHLSSCRFGLVF